MIARKETLNEILAWLEVLFEEGKLERAYKELGRARELEPQNPTLLEWEAVFAVEGGRYRDALEFLDQALTVDQERRFALREKASVLQELGRFEDAIEVLDRAGPDGNGDAAYYYNLGNCQDRLGMAAEADRNFARAAKMEPNVFVAPPRMDREEFDALVQRALRTIPRHFKPYLKKVELVVEDYPACTDLDPFLLGFYSGDLRGDEAHKGTSKRAGRGCIILFKRNLELEFNEVERLEDEVRETVVHEITHHFGLPTRDPWEEEEARALGAEDA